jgi:hypothetical protein
LPNRLQGAEKRPFSLRLFGYDKDIITGKWLITRGCIQASAEK